MAKAKPKQEDLPGMESRDLPEIEQAAERYRQVRDERAALSKLEGERKAKLIQTMISNGRSFYSYNGLIVELSQKENVRVKSKEEPIGAFTQLTAGRTLSLVAEQINKGALDRDGVTVRAEVSSEAAVETFFTQPERCVECQTKDGHQAWCSEYVLGEGTPVEEEDNFTAQRCEESGCGRIDGGHAPTCKHAGALAYPAYLRYAEAIGIKNPKSAARKWELRREYDKEVRAWLAAEQEKIEADLVEVGPEHFQFKDQPELKQKKKAVKSAKAKPSRNRRTRAAR
ncbi:MAG: hypothetical protein ACRETN_05760 [Nevskiales bacterium]